MKASRKRNLRWEHIDKSDTLLLSLVHQFELHNRIEGKSPKTISWYGENLLRFVTYLTGTKSEARLADLNMDTVREYVLHLRSTPKYHKHPLTPEQKDLLSPSTIQGHVRTLRAFASWLEAEGYTECNVLARLKVPKAPNKVTVPLSDTEIASILDCYDPMTAMGCRNRAIIMTLLDTGVRCGELVHIRTEETHIAEGHIKVIGKGSKERMVPIGNRVRKAIQRYVDHFRPEPVQPEEDRLFLTCEGRPMSENALKLMFCRLSKKAGIQRLHVHLLRHAFAVRYLLNGGDVFSLQQILGHTTLEMVKKYLHLTSANITCQHRRFSPMDRLNLRT